jgi:L-asparagine transporter-like permease
LGEGCHDVSGRFGLETVAVMSHPRPNLSNFVRTQYGGEGHPAARRDIGVRRLTLMTVGGIMGSGLFLASGQAIRLAGPAIALAFLIGVTVMALEVTALAEMAAAWPVRGSFLAYARRALGPGAAFVGGWIFWFSSVLNMAAEATAAAVFTRVWLPHVPVVVFSVGYAAVIVALNFLSVRGFSSVEAVMSLAKVVVTLAFILVAGMAILGFVPVPHPVGPVLWFRRPAFAPHGLSGIAASMVLVLFALSGTGILGLAAAHVRRPGRNIGLTIPLTVAITYALYVGAMLGVTGLVAWSHVPATRVSPFVAALRVLPWPWAVDVFNVVILFAVLSAMNAGLFATDRVLETLGRIHDAPRWVARDPGGVPRRANAVTGALLLLASGLAYFLPHTAYLYLVLATGFQALFVWGLIIVSEIYYRPRLIARGRSLPVRMPLFPALSWVAVGLVAAIIATAPLGPYELPALGLGVAVTLLLVAVYLFRRSRRRGARLSPVRPARRG